MQITFTNEKIEIESKLIKPGKMKGKERGSNSPVLIFQKSTVFPHRLSSLKIPMCLASQRCFWIWYKLRGIR